ncbi:MAG: hypothetical protein RIT19_1618, partial [Verrucomicrobiota bacterium]
MLSADGLSGAMIAQDPAHDLSALGAIEVAQDSELGNPREAQAGVPAGSGERLDDLFAGLTMTGLDSEVSGLGESGSLPPQVSGLPQRTESLGKGVVASPKSDPLVYSYTTNFTTVTPTDWTTLAFTGSTGGNYNTQVGSWGASWGSQSSIASLESGWLRLTDASNFNNVAVGFQKGMVNSNAFSVEFDLYISDLNGADGFSFNYGVPSVQNGRIETGNSSFIGFENGIISDGFSVSFKQYNSDRMEVRYFQNGQVVQGQSWLNLPVGNFENFDNVSGSTRVGERVKVQITQSGDLSVTVGGNSVLSTTLTSYQAAVKDNWKFGFGARTGGASSIHAIDNLTIDTAPRITSISSTVADRRYGVGSLIPLSVTFTKPVNVVGANPILALSSGGTATYASGSGTSTLTFNYTVGIGQYSTDLDYIDVSSLSLPSGTTITDTAGNSAILTLAALGASGSLGSNKAIVVDAVAPTVSSVSAPTVNGAYGVGSSVSIQIIFSEAVIVSGGTPYLTLNSGSGGTATYVSGSGTSTLTFNYSVANGHNTADLDYTATTSLTLPAGVTIKDAVGNEAVLTLASPGADRSLGANNAIVVDTSSLVLTLPATIATNATGGQITLASNAFGTSPVLIRSLILSVPSGSLLTAN